VKPEFWTLLLRTTDEYLNLDCRSTEILVPKQAYRVPTGAKYPVLFRPLEQTWCGILTYDDQQKKKRILRPKNDVSKLPTLLWQGSSVSIEERVYEFFSPPTRFGKIVALGTKCYCCETSADLWNDTGRHPGLHGFLIINDSLSGTRVVQGVIIRNPCSPGCRPGVSPPAPPRMGLSWLVVVLHNVNAMNTQARSLVARTPITHTSSHPSHIRSIA
jgi:hypothetical protein